MWYKVLLITAVCFACHAAKAQFMIYESIPLNPSQKEEVKTESNATITNGYAFSSTSNTPIKIKLKVIETKYGVYITGYKKLTDYTWIDFGKYPYQANKLQQNSNLSEYFEFEVYIPSLQKKVYF